MNRELLYKSGYKYQVHRELRFQLPVNPAVSYRTRCLEITSDGVLIIGEGYGWDGPSGLTIDTDNSIKPSLIHDVLYQLMRREVIPLSYRIHADQLLYKMIRENGMSFIRAKSWYFFVRKFGEKYATKEFSREILYSP